MAPFLEALADTANVSRAAKAAPISRQQAYEARRKYKSFRDAWDKALQCGVKTVLEPEAIRRAVEGVEEPAGWYQGKAGGTVRRYSDTLLIFLLKAHDPKRYRERHEIEHTGDVTFRGVNFAPDDDDAGT